MQVPSMFGIRDVRETNMYSHIAPYLTVMA